ncbi:MULTISPECIES: hypothetical protein [unclassified Sphingobacterium]|jgi:hypothetical protein|uniref:hypothetical protein n=1 Tax=unclassified Sphingobacterium TaxID=2609468 RepID=UPI0010484D73|nr:MULTISPECIES: hypothetical protein [unclassified Sphingobacterium]MCS3556611.1 hypothetical protein [Sphingobacterium sp. JUb21]TCQ99903.1 hypothetical protein EDF66_113128 [Sphingobacterium sp. JUb20]
MAWFILNASGNPTDPTNYTLQGSQPSCPGAEQICAIQANQNGTQPEITTALLAEMVEALHDGAATTNVKLKDRV